MIALQIIEIKDFMNKLLATSTFQDYSLAEATIVNQITYHLDGNLDSAHINKEENLLHIPFLQIQNNIFQLIKGKETPSYMKFVLILDPQCQKTIFENTHSSLSHGNISSFYLNILFQNGKLLLTNGIAFHVFEKNNQIESEWDKNCIQFLKKHEIFYETLN